MDLESTHSALHPGFAAAFFVHTRTGAILCFGPETKKMMRLSSEKMERSRAADVLVLLCTLITEYARWAS